MMLYDLANACRAGGLTVVEEPGWLTRGHGQMTVVRGVVCHHTAGPAAGDCPSLAVVRDGRPDLAGPLAHLVLARCGTVHVVAAGLCWHAGVVRDPATQANDVTIGIEAEATGTDPWPDVQYQAYAQLCRALATHYGFGVAQVLGHKEVASPPGRKSDPNFDMTAFRDAVAAASPAAAAAARPHLEDDVSASPIFIPRAADGTFRVAVPVETNTQCSGGMWISYTPTWSGATLAITALDGTGKTVGSDGNPAAPPARPTNVNGVFTVPPTARTVTLEGRGELGATLLTKAPAAA